MTCLEVDEHLSWNYQITSDVRNMSDFKYFLYLVKQLLNVDMKKANKLADKGWNMYRPGLVIKYALGINENNGV